MIGHNGEIVSCPRAGRYPRPVARRVLPILLAALVVASTGAAPASAATPSALLHLRAKGVPLGATNRFRDTILRRPPARAHAAVATGTDLTLKTPDGTALAVTISSQYGNSPQAAQAGPMLRSLPKNVRPKASPLR